MTSKSAARFVVGAAIMLASAGGVSARRSAPPDFVSDHLAGPVVQLHGSGLPHTLKILFLGDGFTSDATSMEAYRQAVDAAVAELLGTDPFQGLSTAITIYRMDVISDEPGIDVPTDCDGDPYDPVPPFKWARSAKSPANALESAWCTTTSTPGHSKKFLIGSDGVRVADFTAASGIAPEITIVLVNDWMFGAAAWADSGILFVSIGQNLVGDTNPDDGTLLTPNDPGGFPTVVPHEVGHSRPFFLLDEYTGGLHAADLTPADADLINLSANLTTIPSPLKWANLSTTSPPHDINCGSSTPPPSEVGRVSGGYGFAQGEGVFHSSCECRMDNWAHPTFCVVCRDRILHDLGVHNLRAFEVPRKDPPPIWVLLDSVELHHSQAGAYVMQYSVVSGADTVSGTWPPRTGGGRPAGALLVSGQPLVVSDLLAILPGSLVPRSSSVTFQYGLFFQPAGRNAGLPGTLVANESFTLPSGAGFVGIVVRNRPTHRITLGLIRP